MKMIRITSEDEAFELLRDLVKGLQFEESVSIEFESWPRFVIRIKGTDFDGTIPTRIMPTLLDLQREVHRLYCLTAYGEENTRRLTKEDRERLELLVRIDKGSSIFETLLSNPVTKIFQDAASKMSPEQLTAVLIVFGISVTSVVAWKMWLNYRTKERELDQTVELSRLEKEKMELFQKAMQKFPATEDAKESVDQVRNDLLTKLKLADNLEIDTSTPSQPYPTPVEINGVQAERMTHKPRETAVERMINDEFFLRTVDFARPEGGVRAEIQRVTDGYSFRADIPVGVLGYDQREALKNNSWSKKNVVMDILVRELYGRYTSAKVVSVKDLVNETTEDQSA
uniref:Uncharacterized protein n=1 Tax=Candidatus Kentrum sp. LFY TaxID=2126342 RepID=A0A450UKN7_9GAMM|nr:MAG: hypothetical protein BECKLFY1418A_GA0070994_102823 [Candidatus Kentron sp. LFY]